VERRRRHRHQPERRRLATRRGSNGHDGDERGGRRQCEDDPRQRRADAALARQVQARHARDGRFADVLLGVAGQRHEAGQRADVVERLQGGDDRAPYRGIGVAGDGHDVRDGALQLVLADEDDGFAAADRVRVAQVVDQAVDGHLPRRLGDGGGGRHEQGDRENRGKSDAHESQPTTADHAGRTVRYCGSWPGTI